MSKSIYNFFLFLEKKRQKFLSTQQKLLVRLKFNKDSITSEEFNALSQKLKIRYFPEKVQGKDLVIKGTYETTSDTILPKGLTVTGTLYVYGLKEKPVDLKANSVIWQTNSDLFPESFTGATFKDFTVNRFCNRIPEGIIVTGTLNLSNSNVKTLPENLNVGTLDAGISKLEKLPSTLTCNILDISGIKIDEIPEGVVVKEEVIVFEMPEKYPKNLKNIITVIKKK